MNNKNKLFKVKSELPNCIIKEFIGLRPKVYSLDILPYHINVFKNEISFYIENLYNRRVSIKYVNENMESFIFYFDASGLIIDNAHEIILDICARLKVNMETYHISNIHFINHLDSYDVTGQVNIRLPQCNTFYDNNTLNKIKENFDFNIEIQYFHLEIDKYFDAYIYIYNVKEDYRPIPELKIMSDMELLLKKTKSLAGVPYHKSGDVNHLDYLNVLQYGKDHLKKLSFFHMKFEKGMIRTLKRDREALKFFDVKRWHKNKEISYSYGHYQIPENEKSYFASDSDISLVSESEIDDERDSLNESENIDEEEENDISVVNDSGIHDNNNVNMFSNRINKYPTLYSATTSNMSFNLLSSDSKKNNEETQNSHNYKTNDYTQNPESFESEKAVIIKRKKKKSKFNNRFINFEVDEDGENDIDNDSYSNEESDDSMKSFIDDDIEYETPSYFYRQINLE